MKLIAQTIKGYEYMHSKELAFFTPNASADKICKIMNDVRFRLKTKMKSIMYMNTTVCKIIML